MADSKLRVDPLTANIGAEVSGLDLREELSQEQVEQLEAALLEVGDHALELELALCRFCAFFGNVAQP